MAKAAHVAAVFLVVHRLCQSQSLDTASSPSCSSLEESRPECAASSAGSLLQVARGKASEHMVDEPFPVHADLIDLNHGEDLKQMTTRELLRQAAPTTETEPLQSTLNSLKDRVTSLEAAAGGRDQTEESGKSGRRRRKGEDKDWAWNGEGDQKDPYRTGEDRLSKTDRQLAQGPAHDRDWDGVAPNAWNGLEKVKAKDKGEDMEGAGTGVSSGKKYKGEYPYEIMMDVDYIIDSNPPETKSPKGQPKAPSSGGKGRPKMPAKGPSKHGGKTSPTRAKKWRKKPVVAPKTSPKSAAKSAPREGAKDAPDTQAKTAAKAGGKTPSALIAHFGRR